MLKTKYQLEVRQVGPVTTNLGDTFTVTINGTPYTASTGFLMLVPLLWLQELQI